MSLNTTSSKNAAGGKIISTVTDMLVNNVALLLRFN